MKGRVSALFVVSGLLVTPCAKAQGDVDVPCQPLDVAGDYYRQAFGEEPRWSGFSDDRFAPIMLLTNEKTGSWSIVSIEHRSGQPWVCLLESGSGVYWSPDHNGGRRP